ncbi:hypothetical protein SLA2020_523070 [Shorea laevis]
MATFHIVMYPWFAMGHITPYLNLANKLAERGHKISFLLPAKTKQKFEPFNLHPDLINLIPITVPHVDGLPPGTETTADVLPPLYPLVMTAMDLTEPTIEASLRELQPQFVFFDTCHWLPELLRKLGIKSVFYCIVSPATSGYFLSPERKFLEKTLTAEDLMQPPKGFPSSTIKLHSNEARVLAGMYVGEFGRGVSFMKRIFISFKECDAIAVKTCKEIEGPYCDYLENQFKRPVILSGPSIPERTSLALDEKWETLLGGFGAKSVIYCAFGSECVLEKEQFQELVLGFELTGLPFLAALKPPMGFQDVESALPGGFEDRVKGKGFVHGGWVQQQLILKHPSVGCFVTHCGSGSLWEAMVNECQMVLLPHVGDQIINARMMGGDMRVGVEVQKGEDGFFTRENVCKAVMSVMDAESKLGKEVKANHDKWREFLLTKGLENSYIDNFVEKLHGLL